MLSIDDYRKAISAGKLSTERARVKPGEPSLATLALCVIAACVVWALIHGWG